MTDKARLADLATLEYATPALRTLFAMVLYLRFGAANDGFGRAYRDADLFIAQLKADYEQDE